jgi:L-lactate dehydrogenase
MHKRSVFIIGGGGMVGATAAQAIAIKEIASDIVLIDVAEDLVRGQAMDINHATAYTNGVHVHVGSYTDIQENDIVIITCGAPQKPGQSRLELIDTNVRIVKDVVGKVMQQGKQVYIVMVTNPVDVLTHVALTESGLPKERVFGTGTMLDTARLRVTLANVLHVSQRHIHAFVLGEHGDSSFPALSHASVSGVPLADFPGFKPGIIQTIDEDIRRAAYQIIEAKKSTYYGIGHVVAQVVEALQRETASILPVCSLAEGEYGIDGVVLGLPTLVSAKGVRILDKYPLDAAEQRKLHDSADVLRNTAKHAETA